MLPIPLKKISPHISAQTKSFFKNYIGYMQKVEDDYSRIDPQEFEYDPNPKKAYAPSLNFFYNKPETMIAVALLHHSIINLNPLILIEIRNQMQQLQIDNEEFQSQKEKVNELFDLILPMISSIRQKPLEKYLEKIFEPQQGGLFSPLYNTVFQNELHSIIFLILKKKALEHSQVDLDSTTMIDLIDEWLGIDILVFTEVQIGGFDQDQIKTKTIYFYRDEQYEESPYVLLSYYDAQMMKENFKITFRFHLKNVLLAMLSEKFETKPFGELLNLIKKDGLFRSMDVLLNSLLLFEDSISQKNYRYLFLQDQQIAKLLGDFIKPFDQYDQEMEQEQAQDSNDISPRFKKELVEGDDSNDDYNPDQEHKKEESDEEYV